jgi:hypothetical protein
VHPVQNALTPNYIMHGGRSDFRMDGLADARGIPWDSAPRHVPQDADRVFGVISPSRCGINQVLSAPAFTTEDLRKAFTRERTPAAS